MALLRPDFTKLPRDMGVLHKASKAVCVSLRRIIHVTREQGTISHDAVLEILKDNGLYELETGSMPRAANLSIPPTGQQRH